MARNLLITSILAAHLLLTSASITLPLKPVPTVLPQPERLVAIGDLHGDLEVLRRVLRLSGVLHNHRDEWVGGKTVVVQVGDQLDRGDDELAVIGLLKKLQQQSKLSGGAVHIMIGNHETMNAQGNAVYATDGAMRKFDRWHKVCRHKAFLPGWVRDKMQCSLYTGQLQCGEGDKACATTVRRMAPFARARFLALRAGGMLAKDVFSQHPTVLVVGDTLFVHGGLLAQHLKPNPQEALTRLNTDMSIYLAGGTRKAPAAAHSGGALWLRTFSEVNIGRSACNMLQASLRSAPRGVTRMVVGHSPQPDGKISSACGGRVWRVDVGMSKGIMKSSPQALEILPGGKVRVLTEDADSKAAGM